MPLIRKDAATPPTSQPLGDITSPSSDARWSAARHLAKDPTSVGALATALAKEDDARVREAIFTSLATIQTPEAVSVILLYIRCNDAGIRAAALDVLNAMPEAVENRVSALLADPDPDVRLLVCDIARHLPGPVATRYLCNLLETESHPNVCGAAVEALSEVGDESTLPVLAQCAERFASEPFLAFAIKTATKRLMGSQTDRRHIE